MRFARFVGLSVVSFAVASGAPISLTPGSLLVLQAGFPSGLIQQYSRTGTAGPTLDLPVLTDIPVSLTVLNGQLFVGDDSGRASIINPSTGAATPVFSTPAVALTSLGNYKGTLLALNEFGPPPAFATGNTINVYSTTGTFLYSITLKSVPPTANWDGMTSNNSIIYIADNQSGDVFEYSPSGASLGFFDTKLGTGLSGASYDVSNNSIWVSDSKTDHVYDFSTTGVLLSDFATDITPAGVAVVPPVATPEPASYMLVLCAAALLGCCRKIVRAAR